MSRDTHNTNTYHELSSIDNWCDVAPEQRCVFCRAFLPHVCGARPDDRFRKRSTKITVITYLQLRAEYPSFGYQTEPLVSCDEALR